MIVLWPIITLFIIDLLIVISAILRVRIPFYLSYVICLIMPLPMNVKMFIYKLMSEVWWVTFAIVVICGVRWCVHYNLLVPLSIAAVITPCMGLVLPEHQIFYFTLLSHLLLELTLLRTPTRPARGNRVVWALKQA